MPKIKLSALQKDVLLFFGKNEFSKNFYWTGGTLLSYLYLSHRLSIDLDFFSDDLFRDEKYLEFINNLKAGCKIERASEIIKENRRLYVLEKGDENVKLELVFFPFPAIEKREKVKEFSVLADSLTDIMVNKTLSTYQRNEVKDIYDLYYYLKNRSKYDLFRLVKLVEKKFGVSIEQSLLLEKINQLVDNMKIIKPFLVDNDENLDREIKQYFQNYFNDLAKNKLK